MATISELSAEEREFLRPHLPHQRNDERLSAHGAAAATSEQSNDARAGLSSQRPFVTLTYACSLDGMISLAPGTRTVLSGRDTKSMTHYLRLKHEAILVGVGTAIADDPSLNCRYPGASYEDQPQPFILDPNVRWDKESSTAQRLADAGKGKQPIALVNDHFDDDNYLQSSSLDWKVLLYTIKAQGIESIMIEGGATVISDLLKRPDLIDAVIITIAPTFLGRGGVSISPEAMVEEGGRRVNAASLANVSWRQFGRDVVMCGTLKK